MNLLEQFDRYLEVEEGRLPKTRTAYLGDIQRFRAWLDESVSKKEIPAWEQVTPNQVRAYFSYLSTDRQMKGKRARKLSKVGPRYIRRVHASLSKFFDYLIEVEKLRTTNPLEDIKKPRLPKRNPSTLKPQETVQLVNLSLEESRVSERVRNWAMIAVLYHTGIRVDELCKMELSHITYREGQPKTIKVIGKGDKERNIALNEEAARALNYWIRETRRQIAAELPPGKDSDYVWLIPAGRSKGNKPQPQTVRVMLRKFGKMMNLRIHPHKLRGSFITDALANGAPIHAVQAVAGHADGSTTLGYANAGTAEQELVVSVLPKIMGKGMLEHPSHKDDSDAVWSVLTPEQKEKLIKRIK